MTSNNVANHGSSKYYALEPIEELPQLEESQAGLTNLITDLSHLIGDRQSTDLIIYVGEKKIPFYTHRLILWARCKGFRHQYHYILSQSYGCQSPAAMTKTYLNPQYFQQVLDYLYIGKVSRSTLHLLLQSICQLSCRRTHPCLRLCLVNTLSITLYISSLTSSG